jgi:hypothetical protein
MISVAARLDLVGCLPTGTAALAGQGGRRPVDGGGRDARRELPPIVVRSVVGSQCDYTGVFLASAESASMKLEGASMRSVVGIRAGVAAVLLSAIPTVFAPFAAADAADDNRFIGRLDRSGVPYTSRVEMIRLAKKTCVGITRQGNPSWRLGWDLQHDKGWSGTQTLDFVSSAVAVYCPDVW